MGAAAGPGLAAAVSKASEAEIRELIGRLDPECVDKAKAVLEAQTYVTMPEVATATGEILGLPAELEPLSADLRSAEELIKVCRKMDFQELKAMCKPPLSVGEVAFAVKVLCEKEEIKAGTDVDGMSFGSSDTIMLVEWGHYTVQILKEKVIEADMCSEVNMNKVRKVGKLLGVAGFEVSDEKKPWAHAEAKKQSTAAAAVGAWLLALVKFVVKAKELGLTLGKEGTMIPWTLS